MASFIQGIKFTARQPDSDVPLSFGKVFTYETGTTSDKATYKDEDKLIPNTNPVILDAYGQADICLDGKYRIVVTDENDNIIDVVDPLSDTVTQLRGLVGDTNGLGSSVLYDAGVSYGQLLIIGDGTSLGKSASYPTLVNPSINLNDMPLQYKIWYALGSSLENSPSDNPLTILQIPNGNGTIMQIAYDLVTTEQIHRVFNGVSWTVWHRYGGIGTLEEYENALMGVS